jgi:hypothetical protein
MITPLLTFALTQTGSIQTQHIKTDTPTMIVSHFERGEQKKSNIFQPKKEEVKKEQLQEKQKISTEQI